MCSGARPLQVGMALPGPGASAAGMTAPIADGHRCSRVHKLWCRCCLSAECHFETLPSAVESSAHLKLSFLSVLSVFVVLYCFLCVKLNEVLTFEHCDNTEPLKIYGLVGCFDQRKTVYRNAIKPIQEHHYCIVPLCWRESVSSRVIIQDFVYFTSAQCILHELSPRRSRCQRSVSIYVATASKVSRKTQTNEKPRSHDKCRITRCLSCHTSTLTCAIVIP